MEENVSPELSNIKKAMLSITVGVMLMSAVPSFAESNTEGLSETQKIELQIQKLQEKKQTLEDAEKKVAQSEKFEQYKAALDSFGIKGLSLREPKIKHRCLCEGFGLYNDGEHVGDVYGFPEFSSEGEFREKIFSLIRENNISKERTSTFYDARILKLDIETSSLMGEWGWGIRDSEKGTYLDFASPSGQVIYLNSDGETKGVEVSIIKKDTVSIVVINKDGSQVTIYGVNGTLVMEDDYNIVK